MSYYASSPRRSHSRLSHQPQAYYQAAAPSTAVYHSNNGLRRYHSAGAPPVIYAAPSTSHSHRTLNHNMPVVFAPSNHSSHRSHGHHSSNHHHHRDHSGSHHGHGHKRHHSHTTYPHANHGSRHHESSRHHGHHSGPSLSDRFRSLFGMAPRVYVDRYGREVDSYGRPIY